MIWCNKHIRHLLLAIMLSAGASVHAQGIFHYYTGLFLPKHDAPPRKDRFFVDVHYATFQGFPEGVKLKPWSHTIQIYRLLDVPFGHTPFSFAFGPGISARNYHFNAQYNEEILADGSSYSRFVPYTTGYQYRKNKLSVNVVQFAAELRVRSKGDRRFRFYAGGTVGYLFNIHTTTIGEDGKFKTYNFQNLNRLQYGVSARLGWHRIMLSASYGIAPLFKKDGGQDLKHLSAGLTVYIF
jgi:hypothetical protein